MIRLELAALSVLAGMFLATAGTGWAYLVGFVLVVVAPALIVGLRWDPPAAAGPVDVEGVEA